MAATQLAKSGYNPRNRDVPLTSAGLLQVVLLPVGLGVQVRLGGTVQTPLLLLLLLDSTGWNVVQPYRLAKAPLDGLSLGGQLLVRPEIWVVGVNVARWSVRGGSRFSRLYFSDLLETLPSLLVNFNLVPNETLLLPLLLLLLLQYINQLLRQWQGSIVVM